MPLDDVKGAPAESPPADPKQDADDDSLDPEDPDKVPDGPLHKSDRWKERNEKAKIVDEHGGSEALRTKLAEYAYWKSLVERQDEERPPEEPKTAEEKASAKELADAYKALLTVAPEVASITAMQKEMRTFWEGIIDAAEETTVGVMEDAGMPTEAKDVKAMSEVLQSIIKEDRKLHLRFRRDPEGAVKRAFERFSQTFSGGKRKDAASTQRDKEKLTTLPKLVKPGGAAPDKKQEPPKTLKEADIRAKEFLAQYTG